VPPGTAPVFTATPASPDATVTVALLAQATNGGGQNVEGEMRRYRVRVRDLNVAFEPEDEWFFSLFVKAAEFRNPALLSDDAPPLPPGRPPRLTAYVPNPIPARRPCSYRRRFSGIAFDAQEVSRSGRLRSRVPPRAGTPSIRRRSEVARARATADRPA
jgi:hypothetical protein